MRGTHWRGCREKSRSARLARIAAVTASVLAGCATTNGPERIVTANGVAAPGLGVPEAKFNEDAKDALDHPSDPIKAQTLLASGFYLTYASCDDYFHSAGNSQRVVIALNDYVAAAGALATSILALTHAGTAAVSATALGTSTFAAGTAIYTKDFLFASENIDSVKKLTLDTIVAHQTSVPLEKLTAYTALVAIRDDQDICSLPHIATLVRQSIRAAVPTPSSSPAGSLPAPTPAPAPGAGQGTLGPNPAAPPKVSLAAVDSSVTKSLQKLLSANADFGPTQVQGLYWLLRKSPTQQEKDGPICQMLVFLPAKTSPLARRQDALGKYSCPQYKAQWPQHAKVDVLLATLSQPSIDALEQSIAQLRATATAPPAAAAGNPPGVQPDAIKRVPSTHINVDVF